STSCDGWTALIGIFSPASRSKRELALRWLRHFRLLRAAALSWRNDREWFRFVRTVHAGEFDDALALAAKAVHAEVLIRVSLGIMNDPGSFDPDAPTFPRGDTTFIWDPGTGSIRWLGSDGAVRLAPAMPQATSVRQALEALDAAENKDWLWTNVLAGVTLRATANIDAVEWSSTLFRTTKATRQANLRMPSCLSPTACSRV